MTEQERINEKIRELKNRQSREWAKRNPSKVKASQKRYWIGKVQEKYAGINIEVLTEQELENKIREVKNEYHKRYVKQNPNKIKKHINDYWKRKAVEELKKEA